MNVIAFNVQLFSSLSVITIRNRGFSFLLAGRFVIKSIDNSLWNLSGTGRGFKNPFHLFLHRCDLLRAGSRRQASLRKTDAVGVRENLSSGPAKPGKPLRKWIRIHFSRLFSSRSTRFCSCFSLFFINLI
jgi:hypothetical protein